MELELIDILNELYIKYGTTEEVLKLSRVIDNIVVDQQRINFREYLNLIN
ncbi:hypothetical protein [Clostridium sp.]